MSSVPIPYISAKRALLMKSARRFYCCIPAKQYLYAETVHKGFVCIVLQSLLIPGTRLSVLFLLFAQDRFNPRAEPVLFAFLFYQPQNQVSDSAGANPENQRKQFRDQAAKPNARNQQYEWNGIGKQARLHDPFGRKADRHPVAHLCAGGIVQLDFHFVFAGRKTGAAVRALRAALKAYARASAFCLGDDAKAAALLFH
jgi:hypothetical protein